jgi:hypothetical protein
MLTFYIPADVIDSDYAGRVNLFALAGGGDQAVGRVIQKKMVAKGYVAPAGAMSGWTPDQVKAYQTAYASANDGSTLPFDFITTYPQLAVPIVVNNATKTFTVGSGSAQSFNGMVCDVLLNTDMTITTRSVPKTPGQVINGRPQGTVLLAQLHYDASNDKLFIVAFTRFVNQTVVTATATFSDPTSNVYSAPMKMSSPYELLPLLQRLFCKRWAILSSPSYVTNIQQSRGLPSNQYIVLEDATYLNVVDKTKPIPFYLSRMFSKFDYQFKLTDFTILSPGLTVTIGADNSMNVTVLGPSGGTLEVIPKKDTRIFLSNDVIATSDLHLRLTVT